MDVFDVLSKDKLKDKMTLVLISNDLWKKWWTMFELYKNGSLACSPKSIKQDDFVQNKTKQYGSNFFRPLCDMDEAELHIVVEKIMDGFVWLSTIIDHNVHAKTLAQYCKWVKDERTTRNMICEYFKVQDNEFYTSQQVSNRNVVEVYKIVRNHFVQLCTILCVEKQVKKISEERGRRRGA
jgi:hypothetical protein